MQCKCMQERAKTVALLKLKRLCTASSLYFPSFVAPIISQMLHFCPAAALKPDVVSENSATTLNHSMALVQRMEALLTQGNGSDVILRVQTLNTDEVKVIQVHSLVLTLQSDVFDELLQTRNSTVMVLRETADCAAVFDKFIR